MENARKLTVLLADDDKIILEDISHILPWEDLGFQIVGKARSGKQALTLYRDLRPNIVITDIIMPSMDGIELIREIQKIDLHHDTKFLILSSYGDFSYAKSAIQLGISDYLLKPELSAESLEKVLRKLAFEISNGAITKFNMNRLQLTSFFKHASLDPSGSDLEDHFLQNPLFFFLCSVSDAANGLYNSDQISTFLKHHMLELFDRLEFSSKDCIFPTDSFLIFGIHKKKTPFSPENMCHKIQLLLSQLGCSCQIVYTRNALPLVSYKKNWFLYQNICRYTLTVLQSSPFQEFESLSLPSQGSARQIVPEYEDFVPMMKSENASSQLQDLLDMIHGNRDYEGLQKLLRNLCKYFSISSEKELKTLNSPEDIQLWIERNLSQSAEAAEDPSQSYSSHVRNAIAFMKGHYVDSTLSVESISGQIGISTGRLSVLFKKETSMTVNEYLTSIRIQAAISLLQNSNYKIYEIAEKVGYNSSQYFSRIFFNTTGRKPLDYRNHSFTKFTLGE